jgi:redox-sensing transcriptional repressor
MSKEGDSPGSRSGRPNRDQTGLAPEPGHRLSRASAARLSLYLRRLESLLGEGKSRVSSSLLGETLGIGDAQVRKDLAVLGGLGHPGVGYHASDLITAIRRTLGIDRDWRMALVGVGNLGQALLRYQGFTSRGFRVVALFDRDPGKVGLLVDGLPIHPPERMAEVLAESRAELGILAVPSEAAQEVAEALIGSGIRGLLNFAPCVIRVPAQVPVVSVDLTVQLEQLAFLLRLPATG